MTRAAERERDEDEGIVDIGSLFGAFPRGKKVEKYDDEARDDEGRWTAGDEHTEAGKALGPKPDYETWEGGKAATDYDGFRAADHKWEADIHIALSRGDISPEEAKSLGYFSPGSVKWGPLPTDLYHVTTAATSVAQTGLKTRAELSMGIARGLGGGQSNTISFTTDPALAETIRAAVVEAHKVAAGEITIADLLQQAKDGTGANRPFLDDIVRANGGDHAEGQLPVGMQDLLAGVTRQSVSPTTIDKPPAEPERYSDRRGIVPGTGPWVADTTRNHWTGGDGVERYTSFTRPMSDTEKSHKALDLYKTFSFWREYAGGSSDPLFFGTDAVALAKQDPAEIQIVHVTPAPKAQGYQMEAMGEWRTGSGQAVKIVSIGGKPLETEKMWHLRDDSDRYAAGDLAYKSNPNHDDQGRFTDSGNGGAMAAAIGDFDTVSSARYNVPNLDHEFAAQAVQYPPTGKVGMSYFKGDLGNGTHVDCLLYRNKDKEVVGILNHFPVDLPPYEAKGNVNTLVRKDYQRQGIGTKLLKEAIKRWGVNFGQQSYTQAGLGLARSLSNDPSLKLMKYSPDQERDARGRFGSGDGGDSSADEHGAFTGTSKWADAGPRISPHYAQPEPLPPSGRGTTRPENPHATELSGLSKAQSAAVVASVLAASPDKAHPLTMARTVKNLVGQYKEMVDPKSDNYDPQSEKDGKPWYPVAHEVGRDMAALSGVSVRQAIGMIAATSPQCQWDQNRAIAEYMNRKLSEDKPLKDVNEQILDALRTEHGVVIHNGQKLSEMTPKEAAWALKTMGQTQDNLRCLPITKSGDLTKVGFVSASINMAKAIRIFRGADPDKVLGGHKVRSFFNNIADPDNAVDVTIDTHAISAAALYDMPTSSQEIKDLLEIGKSKSDNVVGNYAFFADAYRAAAAQVGEIPSVFQAQLWLHWSGSDQPGGWKGTSDQYPKAKPTATAAARQRRLNQRANKSEASEAEQAVAEMDWFNKLVVRIGHPEWAAWDYGKDLSDGATIVKGNPNHDAEGRFSSDDDDDSEDDEASTDGFQSRLGRCYELAGRFAMDSDPKDDVKVVHGSIQGAGAPRIGHAWNILADGTIHDPVLNQNFSPEVHQQFFHAISDHVYTAPEAVMQMLKTRHFGPWETPEIEKYADDEPRDEAGRWESGGEGGGTPTASGDHEETGAFLGTDENNGTDGLEKPMMYAPVVDLPPLTDGTVRTQDLKVGDKIMADDGTTKEVAFKTANTADLKLARGWPITGLRYDVTFTDGTTQKLLDTAVHTLAGDDGKPLVVATPEPPAPVTPAPAPVEYKMLETGHSVILRPGDRIFRREGGRWGTTFHILHSGAATVDDTTTIYGKGDAPRQEMYQVPPGEYPEMGYTELQPYDLPTAPPAWSGPDTKMLLPNEDIATVKAGDRLFGSGPASPVMIAHADGTTNSYGHTPQRRGDTPLTVTQPKPIERLAMHSHMSQRDWSEATDVKDVRFVTLPVATGTYFDPPWNAMLRPGDKIYRDRGGSVVIQRAFVPLAPRSSNYAGIDRPSGPSRFTPADLAKHFDPVPAESFPTWQPALLAPPVIRSDVTPAIREAGARFLISSPQFEDAAFAGAPELRAAIDFERAGYATVGAFATDKLLEAKTHGYIATNTTGQQDKLDDLITVLKTATKPADIKGQSAIAKMARERMKSGAKLQAMGEQARNAMSYLDAVGVAVANHTDIPSPPTFMSGMPVKGMTDMVTAFVDNTPDSLFGRGTNMPVNINDIAVHEKIMEVGRKVAAAIDADPHIVSLRKQLDEKLEANAADDAEKTKAWQAMKDAQAVRQAIEDKQFKPHQAEFEALRNTNWQAALDFRKSILAQIRQTPEHIAASKAIEEAYTHYESFGERIRQRVVHGVMEGSTIAQIKRRLDTAYDITTRKELGKYQEMGGGQKFGANQIGDIGMSSKEAVATLNEALSLYPTSWVNRAANRTAERPFRVDYPVPRGGFTDGVRMLLSPHSASIGNAVATHEAGHMMEKAIPGLTNAEAVHFLTRTMTATGGRGVMQSLRQLTGVKDYRSDEKATPDEFVNGYQGKRYDDWTDKGRAASAELFTHGIQCVMHPTTDNGGMVGLPLPAGLRDKSARNEDRESRVFVLGALATLNPPAVPPTGTYRTEDRMAEVDNG